MLSWNEGENRHCPERRRRFAGRRSFVKGKGHILFVDDDAQICDSQKKALELLGYTVTAMQDSRAAEEIFSKSPNQFDLLILDLNMWAP